MSFWHKEPNGDNPHWLCVTLTALPVLIALGLVWANRPPAAARTPEPMLTPATEARPTTDHHLTFAAREP
jgi:hypothetical protein